MDEAAASREALRSWERDEAALKAAVAEETEKTEKARAEYKAKKARKDGTDAHSVEGARVPLPAKAGVGDAAVAAVAEPVAEPARPTKPLLVRVNGAPKFSVIDVDVDATAVMHRGKLLDLLQRHGIGNLAQVKVEQCEIKVGASKLKKPSGEEEAATRELDGAEDMNSALGSAEVSAATVLFVVITYKASS
jgi:hypothetical protein